MRNGYFSEYIKLANTIHSGTLYYLAIMGRGIEIIRFLVNLNKLNE